jgi:hypothetical protein
MSNDEWSGIALTGAFEIRPQPCEVLWFFEVLEKDKHGRAVWRPLRQLMTEQQAKNWSGWTQQKLRKRQRRT